MLIHAVRQRAEVVVPQTEVLERLRDGRRQRVQLRLCVFTIAHRITDKYMSEVPQPHERRPGDGDVEGRKRRRKRPEAHR